MSDFQHHLYEFDDYRLDTRKGVLLRNGDIVPMASKAFDTLRVLVANSGIVMTKDELMDIIWPDTAVEENNLTHYISSLRKILNQDLPGNPYIETIPKRGYRFVANVREVEVEEIEQRIRTVLTIEQEEVLDSTEPEIKVVPPKPTIFSKWRSLTATQKKLAVVCFILLGLLVTTVVAVRVLRQGKRQQIPPNPQQIPPNFQSSLRITAIESWKGAPGDALVRVKFSPDGNFIVTPLIKNGQLDIYVKQINGGDPQQIIDDEWKEHDPIWSSDGQKIAFASDRGNQKGIWIMPSFGGTPELVAPLNSAGHRLQNWSKDKSKIYYESEGNFFALNVQSKEISQLTNFNPANSAAANFFLSPDETQIVYTDTVNGQSDVFVMPAQGGSAKQITNDPETDNVPVWLPDGKGIAYSSNRNGIYQIFVIYLDGRAPLPVIFGDNDCFVGDISSDGSRILYRAAREDSDLWRIKLDGSEDKQVTDGVNIELWPAISPDGNSIAFHSIKTIQHLYNNPIVMQSIEAAKAKKIELTAEGFEPKWSPDGSRIAFLRFSGDKKLNLWRVSNVGTNEKQLTFGHVNRAGYSYLPYNKDNVSPYSWSPDSSKLVYCSAQSGLWNVWTVSADGQNETNISNNIDVNWYCSCPIFSPDGKHIAYQVTKISPIDKKSTKLIYVFDGEKNQPVFETDLYINLIGWNSSGNDLLVTTIAQTSSPRLPVIDVNVLRVLSKSNPIQLKNAYLYNIRLSPDGQFIAFAAREGEKDFIRVVPYSGGQFRNVKQAIEHNSYFSNLVWSPDSKVIYYARQEKLHFVSMIENFK
jgi:Tol biopolymer transport system component/DNA-binding winged helix-turn-helix (wHTH) protein